MASTLEKLIEEGLLWSEATSTQATRAKAQFIKAQIEDPKPVSSLGISSFNLAEFNLDEIDNALPFQGLPFGHLHEWCLQENLQEDDAPHNLKQLSSKPGYVPCSILAYLIGNALCRIFGSEKNSAGLYQLKISSKVILWIGERYWPTPHLLEPTLNVRLEDSSLTTYHKINLLDNCLFIDPPNQELLLWTIETALRSNSVAAIVSGCKNIKLATTRRLASAAKNSGTLLFLIRNFADLAQPSAAYSRWIIAPALSNTAYPHWRVTLAKIKGGSSINCSWEVEFDTENYRLRKVEEKAREEVLKEKVAV